MIRYILSHIWAAYLTGFQAAQTSFFLAIFPPKLDTKLAPPRLIKNKTESTP
jgi:hypothetical protein